MQHVLSTHLFVNHRLTTVWLERVWQAGIPAIEIFCARQHLDYRDRAQIHELGHFFHDSELKLHSVHAPMYTDEIWGRSGPQAVIDITDPIKVRRFEAVDEIKRTLEIAETIPFRYLIVHLGTGGTEYSEARVDAGFSTLEELSLFARQRGVEVLLENTPNELSSAERLRLFLDITHLNLGLCLDVGHANMKEGVEAAFRLMESRLRSTHLHDNDGVNDQHLLPFGPGGSIDWKKTMELLRNHPDQYPLLLELREPQGVANPIEAARDIFPRLESA